MGWLDRLAHYTENLQSGRTDFEPPRHMTDAEFQSIISDKPPKPPTTTAEIRKAIFTQNPVRWKRLQREIAWMKKRMKKMGLNPEDFRWVL